MKEAGDKIMVACCQLAPRVGELKHNRQISLDAIRMAAARGAQVVVLPELVQSGYVFVDRAEALSLSESLDGPTLTAWKALAHELGIVIVAGFCERLEGGEVGNSAVLIDPNGLRVVYRKAHLWDSEKLIFTTGSQPPPVVETQFGRIAIMICYDLEFAEWVRMAALAGAELLCAPVNWPAYPRPDGERPAEVVRVQALASVHRMYIAACGRSEQERGVDWVGGSVIVDCNGYPLAGPLGCKSDSIICATLDLSEARDKWISERNHVHEDRRPELYLHDQ
jgi:predicted amidohydrolase